MQPSLCLAKLFHSLPKFVWIGVITPIFRLLCLLLTALATAPGRAVRSPVDDVGISIPVANEVPAVIAGIGSEFIAFKLARSRDAQGIVHQLAIERGDVTLHLSPPAMSAPNSLGAYCSRSAL